MQSTKQEWSRERNWQMYGSLSGIVQRVDQIARARSTSIPEYDRLVQANMILKSVLKEWRNPKHLEESLQVFIARTS